MPIAQILPGTNFIPETVSGPDVHTLVDIVADSDGHSLHPLHRSLGVKPNVDLLGGVVWTTGAHHQVTVQWLSSAAQVSK